MKKSEIQVGKVYAVKVSGNIAPVRVDAEYSGGGWIGTNLRTRKTVRIKSAQRCRREWAGKVEGGFGWPQDRAGFREQPEPAEFQREHQPN